MDRLGMNQGNTLPPEIPIVVGGSVPLRLTPPTTIPSVPVTQSAIPPPLTLIPPLTRIQLPNTQFQKALVSNDPLPEPLEPPREMTKKGRRYFTMEEDRMIMKCINIFGGPGRWSEIARRLPGRTGKQCRARYINYLDSKVKQGSWSPDEDALLMSLWKRFGMKWSKICKLIPGRTANSSKNRFNALMRKKKRGRSIYSDADYTMMNAMFREVVPDAETTDFLSGCQQFSTYDTPTMNEQLSYTQMKHENCMPTALPLQGGPMYSAGILSPRDTITKRQRVTSAIAEPSSPPLPPPPAVVVDDPGNDTEDEEQIVHEEKVAE